MAVLYQISIHFFILFLRIISLFNQKVRISLEGRKNWISELEDIPKDAQVIWFHCASLGEFDQGLPVMHALKNNTPNAFILVTFFSPSGMDHYDKRTHPVDKALYLPFDTKINALTFIRKAKPKLAVFVKYEFWPNFILECRASNVKLISISTLLRKNQIYFKGYGGFFARVLKNIDYFFVQNEETKSLLESIGINNVEVSGDTRYDQVGENIPTLKLIKKYPCIILGSSWKDEEVIAAQNIREINNISWIIAPHEIDQKKVLKIKELFGKDSVLFSELDVEKHLPKILIIDKIGVLAELYFYSDIAFIGGGFSGKLHNILEAASKGNFILFGPKIKNYPEANLMLKEEVSQVVEDKESFKKIILELISNPKELERKQERAIELIKENRGATNKVWNEIEKLI